MRFLRRLSTVTTTSGSSSKNSRAWASTIQPIKSIQQKVVKEVRIRDESSVYTPVLIFIAIVVALFCGLAAFLLHLFVGFAGCLGGVNGCHDHILLDALKPIGIGTSLYFIISCPLSGLICSLILYNPRCGGVTSLCKGGGGGHTKILVAAGSHASGWVAPLRILLAALYMGGGNPLGTEGPIIHLSVTLATWLVSKTGKKRRKFLSTFAVIGAAAGISAGFNVLVAGFVYVIEELTRTLSRKLALILAFAAAMAVLFAGYFEKLLHMWVHGAHASLVPAHSTWARLTDSDIEVGLVLCIPIGVLSGFAGWIFVNCAWLLLDFLNPGKDSTRPGWFDWLLPQKAHLAIVGLIVGCLGAIGYEATGMNGVWGTTVGAIPEAIEKHLGWGDVLLLFVLKFAAFILATAASGPGGLLVPSFATGGLLALAVGRCIGVSDDLCAACAVIGMGSMFASVMHMPLTGVIIIFELTRADNLMVHVVIANFIATNIVCRLPHGEHSFVHRCLEMDSTWHKLKERDFIETDDHEKDADLALFVNCVLLTDDDRIKITFERWVASIRLDHAVINALNERELERSRSSIASRGLFRARTALFVTADSNDRLPECAQILPSPHSTDRSSAASHSRTSTGLTLKRSQTGASVLSRASRERSLRDSRSSICSDTDVVRLSQDMNGPLTGVPRDEDADITGPELRRSMSGRLRLVNRGHHHSLHSADHSCSPELVAQRRQVRDQWTLVSGVIPDLNMRVWHALTYAQRNALCSAIELMECKTPHADDERKNCFLTPLQTPKFDKSIELVPFKTPHLEEEPKTLFTPVHSPNSGKILRTSRSGTDDLVHIIAMGPSPTEANGQAATEEADASPPSDAGWKVMDIV